jgi:hypothetical protein
MLARIAGWFKSERTKHPDAAAFVRAVPSILDIYGGLLEKYPAAYIDETWLPVDKESMKGAFKSVWILAADDDGRKWIEHAWMNLSLFQPGVGELPVTCDVLGDATQENVEKLNRWLSFANIGQKEDEVNLAELLAFTRTQEANST